MGNKVTKREIYDDIRNGLLNESDLYKIISNKGGGFLIELVREAIKSNNFIKVDEFLRNEMVKYLYNDGKGQNVS